MSASIAASCIHTGGDRTPERGDMVTYDVYCPTRLTKSDAEKLGRGIIDKSLKIIGGDPISYNHTHAGPLRPIYVDAPHVFHYGCHRDGRKGVATHFKLRYRAHDTRPIDNVAARCTFGGSQNGGVAIGARVDREYRCPYKIRSDDGKQFAQTVASRAVQRDLVKQVRDLGGKICMLSSTDAQCAPCVKTDKLVARMQIVGASQNCPSGTYWEIR
jgi:hypothetical protein